MAPEQLRRAGREGPETDQWAIALVAFRALTGHSYFETARNVAELILAIVHEPLPLPSSLSTRLPPTLDAWFLRSCSRNPGDRFPDVESQQCELERVLGAPTPLPLELGTPAHISVAPSSRSQQKTVGSNTADSSLIRIQRNRMWLTPFYFGLAVAALFAFVGTWWLHATLQPKQNAAHSSRLTRVVMTKSSSEQQSPLPAATAQPAFEQPNARISALSGATSKDSPTPLAKKDSSIRRAVTRSTRSEHSPGDRATHLLPHGAACTRSTQCADGLCAAEVCQ